jgi:hypothetical protein
VLIRLKIDLTLANTMKSVFEHRKQILAFLNFPNQEVATSSSIDGQCTHFYALK